MAGSPSILKEFLVAIGFKVDDQQYKNFQSKFKTTVDQFEKLGKIAVISGTAMSVALVKVASDMEKLYFASQRAGTSVTSLMGLRFAAEQIGIGADAATAGVTSLATALRTNPGLRAFFTQLGVKETGDNTKNFINLIQKLQELSSKGAMGHALATQIAAQFGMDEQTLFMYEKNLPELLKMQDQFRKRGLLGGVDIDKTSAQFHKFMEDVRMLLQTLEIIGIAGFGKLLPDADRLVLALQRMADWLLRISQATHGWASAIATVATVLGGMVGSMKIMSWIAGMFGGGAAAGGAAMATEGGAAAAGGGGMAVLGPLGLAALDIGLAAHDIKEGSKLYRSYKDSGTFQSMIAKLEGFSSKVYKDVAGYATVGYGHRVRPGEDFQGGVTQAGAAQMLVQDTAAARAAVLRLVKVALNSNELSALTDFVFNVGPSAFAGSTLLKDLNAGNYAGAAAQFERWNQAGGMVRAGLTSRRLGEKELFNRPDLSVGQNTTIHVYGNNDPAATGAAVASQQRQVNADLLRDMGAKVQ